MQRRRTLRSHAFLIALVVILSPLLVVMSTNWVESLFGDRTLEKAESSAREIAVLYGTDRSAARERITELAAARHQRIRVIDQSGQTLEDANSLYGRSLKFIIGDILYGPERKLVLDTLDRDYGAPADRPEVRSAAAGKAGAECRFSTAGNLFLCSAARPADAFTVLVEGSSRRALGPLYESRRQLAKLLLFAGALALVLAWWTMRWFVKPVEALRNELLAKANRALPKASGSSRHVLRERPRELSDLDDAFGAVVSALEERNRANEAFLADLAHEFKNPVAAVRAVAERMGEPGALDEQRKARLAEALKQSSVQLDSLVTQFLELARAEAGLPNEQREEVNLIALLGGLVDALSRDPRYEQVRFEFQREGTLSLPVVPQRLELALRNLLENAASFAGENGWVRVSAEATTDGARITISDSGPGIPAEHLPKLFNRFFTRRGDKHGTGLGLALVRAVVEAHRGTVRAESPAGQGATFIVTLPFTNVSQAVA